MGFSEDGNLEVGQVCRGRSEDCERRAVSLFQTGAPSDS